MAMDRVKRKKCLSLRENADTTRQASAPAASWAEEKATPRILELKHMRRQLERLTRFGPEA
jgi:hypothetical protein